jgi:Flp pilus assembly protein TadG
MNGDRRSFNSDERGQAIFMVAIVFMALMFFVGLAVDVGQLYSAKRAEQEAADSAAFGAAIVLYQGGTVSEAISAARSDAITNGFTGGCALTTAGPCTDAATRTTVTVNSPPQSGGYQTSSYIEVIIVRQVRTSLVPAESVLNPVKARGVAGAAQSGGTGYAVITLANTGTCIFMSIGDGGINVNTTGTYAGGVFANCPGASSINAGASGKIIDPYGIFTVGNPPASCCTGPLSTGQTPIADPFAGFPKPLAAGANITKSCASPNLAPGYYADLNTSTCSWHLTGGNYIIRGGNFNPGNYTIDEAVGSTGVLIFMTKGNYDGGPGGATCGSINETGSSNITLKGQASGQWKNMVFYMDPACGTAITHHINSGNGLNVTGTVYAPTATFDFNPPGVNVPCFCQLIVWRLQFDTGDDLNTKFDAGAVGATGIIPALVE